MDDTRGLTESPAGAPAGFPWPRPGDQPAVLAAGAASVFEAFLWCL